MDIIKKSETQEKFELACKNAENLSLVQNAGAAFQAVNVVKSLKEVLTDEVMNNVFMPLMNTKIGFLTDRPVKDRNTGKVIKPEYGVDVVRDAIIDAASFGLLPTFNQFNIIAEKMYPTKEGYTALLKKLDVVYVLNFGADETPQTAKFAQISVKIIYRVNGEDQKPFVLQTVVPKTQYSSYDQLKGKAERRAKKWLYEFVTGHDLGEGDTTDYNSASQTNYEPRKKYEEAEVVEEQQDPEDNNSSDDFVDLNDV